MGKFAVEIRWTDNPENAHSDYDYMVRVRADGIAVAEIEARALFESAHPDGYVRAVWVYNT